MSYTFNIVKDTVYKVNQVAGSVSGYYDTGITIGSQEYISSITAGAGRAYITTTASASKTIHVKFYAYKSNTYTEIADAIWGTQSSGTITKTFNELTWTSSNLNSATTTSAKIYIQWEGPGTITWNQIKGSTNGAAMTFNTTALSYTLTTTVSPAGYGTVTAGGSMAYNATKQLVATPSTGRSFSSWTKTAGTLSTTTAATTTFTMGASAATVTANFITNSYTLTTAASPTGGGSVTAGVTMAYGATKQLVATASTGYSFSSWSKTAGTLSTTTAATTTFTMGTSAATVTANFTLNSYTLTTAVSPTGGGSVTAGGSMGYNTKKQLTATASTGYTFSSWSKTAGTLSSTTANPTTFTIGNGAATVTANFTLNSYTLTTAVSPTGGGTVTAGGSMGYNTKKQLTATASSGYTFSSWSKTAGTLSSTTANPTTFTIGTSAATVTANFTVNTYTLTVAKGTGISAVTGGGNKAYKSSNAITATVSTGYTFKNWTSNNGGTFSNANAASTSFTMPVGATTVTANATINTYTLTVSKGTGIASVTGGGNVQYNSKNGITATASTGYTFNKWTSNNGGTFGNANAATTTFTMPAGAATVTASATLNSYTLTTAVSPTGGGTVTAGATMGYNTKKQLTATASTGYTFSGWTNTSGSLSSTTASPTTFTMGAAAATVTASFTINTYTLTVAKGTGIASVTGGGNVNYNSKNQITATVSTGYTFKNWTSNNGGTFSNANAATTTFTMPAGAVTVTANTTLNSYTLTTQVSPSEGGTVTAGGSMGYNTQKQLTATPAAGYSFSEWNKTSGTLSSATANPTTYTISAGDATVTASFSKINYTITTTTSPSGAGTITVPQTAQMGDIVTLSQTPSTGYIFDGWTSSDVTITNNQFTMPANNVAITANYYLGQSTAELDKDTYAITEPVTLTIHSASNAFSHKYRLRFSDELDTGFCTVESGITEAMFPIPFEWALHLYGSTTVTGGVFTLQTYSGNTLIGTDEISGLTLTALDGVIPSLTTWRADANGNPDKSGLFAKYSIVKPQSVDVWSLSCVEETVNNPELTGDILPTSKINMPLANNYTVICTMSKAYSLTQRTSVNITSELPRVVIVGKNIP